MSTQPEGTTPDPYSPQPPAGPGFGSPAAPGFEAPPTTPGFEPPAAPGYPAPPATPGFEAPAAAGYPAPSANHGYPAAPVSPYSSTPSAPGTDGLAIGALVTGILSLGIVPIVLGALALARVRKSGQSGHGMAIAGIVLGALSTLAWTVGIIFVVIAGAEGFREGFEESYEESAGESFQESIDETVESLGETSDIAVGECFADPDAVVYTDDVEIQDCAGPHGAEVYAEHEIAGDTYPGEDAVFAEGDDACLAEFDTFVGIDYDSSELDFGYFYPTKKVWAYGDHGISCYLVTVDGSELTGSARGIAR